MDKAKKDLAEMRDESITGMSKFYTQTVDRIQKTAAVTIKTMNKAIEKALNQYNRKVQHVADSVPGNFGKNAAGYPWVTVTATLALGLLLGALLKPGRQSTG